MNRILYSFVVFLLLPIGVAAQPIHGNPQKAAYASPAEWPTVSSDCWWEAPGSGGLPGPSHIGHLALTLPVGAETTGTPITGRFSITTFNAIGQVMRIAGARLKSWALDAGLTLPQTTDPTGVRTWTGTVTFDTANTPAKGWYQVNMEYVTRLANGDETYTKGYASFYSMRDPTAKDTGYLNIAANQCRVRDSSTPGLERWGQQTVEFQTVLPLLGPISPELPWTLPVAGYTYGATGPLPEGIVEIRLDPDFHNGNPGTLLYRAVGNKIVLPYTLPVNIPEGWHRVMHQWHRPDPAGTRILTSNLVFSIFVGPGGAPQPSGTSSGGTSTGSHGTTTPPPPTHTTTVPHE